jgi:hypothetical protein
MIPDSELTYETQFNAEFWKYDSEFHRDFGPAIIYPQSQYWYQHGKLSRLDGGPALMGIEFNAWFKNHLYHREDGPAVVYSYNSGCQDEWWVNGVDISDEVDGWLKENDYSYPFTDEQQMMFKLRFC